MASSADELALIRRHLASVLEEREAVTDELAAVRDSNMRIGQALSAFCTVCQSAASDLADESASPADVMARLLTALAAACAGVAGSNNLGVLHDTVPLIPIAPTTLDTPRRPPPTGLTRRLLP